MNIRLLQVLLLAATLLAPGTSALCSELSERADVRNAAKAAYAAGDLQGLIRQHATYSDFLHQRTSSGASKDGLFFDGIDEAHRLLDGEQLQADIARTKQWSEAASGEPLPYILHACALLAYAQHVRGRGFANTVPPQAWKVHSEYVGRAIRFLLDNKEVASRSTSWHVWLLNALRSAGAQPDAVMRIFEAGVAQSPENYRVYYVTLHYFLPKWHGDVQAVDAFIRRAASVAPVEYGEELYARLYSGAEQEQFGRKMYAESLVDWERMKAGLMLWNQRFPTRWNKNILAYHACIAGDKNLFKEILPDLGSSPEWPIWQPNAESTFLACKRWASEPDAQSLPSGRASVAGKNSGSPAVLVAGAV